MTETTDSALLARLADKVSKKVYGKHKGFVVDNQDPSNLGRLKLLVPSLLGDQETDWAMPCMPYGGTNGQGWYAVPEVDAAVWVEFEAGEINAPIWVGTFWQKQGGETPEPPGGVKPDNKIFQTTSGHFLAMEDTTDEEFIYLHHASGAELQMNQAGSIAITDAGGASITMDAEGGVVSVADSNGNTLTMDSAGTVVEDASGNKIEMTASGIKVQGTTVVVKGEQVTLGGEAGEPIIKGSSFLTLFATHIHPTAQGPSGPPIPQGEASALSTKVMTG